MTDKNLGHATAYGYAKSKGYTGTEEEFAELMASYAEVAESAKGYAEQAEASATNAETSETNARTSAQTASAKASEASASASNAQTSASNAQASATSAGTSASSASASAQTASTKASEASDSATSASESASTAVSAKDDAVTAKEEAKTAKADAETAAEEAQESAQTVANKADKDGTYPDMTVGGVMSSDGFTDSTPYLYRESGGGVEVGTVEEDSIVGGTVAWNQLCNSESVTVPNGHKYLLEKASAWSVGSSTGTAITGLASGADMLIDLTQMFGSTIADYIYSLEQSSTGAGVAFFRKMFPKDYYEYNTGELMSVEGLQSHDMVGFNQWDEEWETGYYDSRTGEKKPLASEIRSKNLIRIFPNTVYARTGLLSGSSKAFFDAEKNFIGVNGSNSDTFTTPSNAYYMALNMGGNYGNTYKNDICINISSDRNGEYEPYIKHSYPLDSSLTLRGIPKLSDGLYFDGDTYEADGTVTRKYGVVDLGTLNWGKYDVTQGTLFRATPPNMRNTAGTVVGNLICTKYPTSSVTGSIEKSIQGNSVNVDVIDSDYATASDFRSAMSGVMLVYELATPTTESAEPYESIQKVSKYGTEEYVSTGIVPVGHVTKYPTDIVSKVNGLPSDFSTLIAPTETGFKATRAYSVNQFIIVNNQLYRVTSAIASGATITVGTNVTATTVADILTALLNA